MLIGGGYVFRHFVDHIGNIPNSQSQTILATFSRELSPASTLTLAGGTTKRIPINYRKVAEGAEQDNFLVQPGDIIVVP